VFVKNKVMPMNFNAPHYQRFVGFLRQEGKRNQVKASEPPLNGEEAPQSISLGNLIPPFSGSSQGMLDPDSELWLQPLPTPGSLFIGGPLHTFMLPHFDQKEEEFPLPFALCMDSLIHQIMQLRRRKMVSETDWLRYAGQVWDSYRRSGYLLGD
jgi:hypothetical protein